MLARIARLTLALLMAAAPMAFFALPGIASADARDYPIRKGVYDATWHTDKVQIIITKVERDGTFVGELRFDPEGRWGDVRTGIKGQLHNDDSLDITRDDCDGLQGARTGKPERTRRGLVWKGEVKGPDFTSTFELWIPKRRR
jgi:hypothetical protein